jgi:hypothetical protein
MSNRTDRHLRDPQGDQLGAVLSQGADQSVDPAPDRLLAIPLCSTLESILTFTHGYGWPDVRINEFGHGEYREGEALRRGIAGVTAALDLVFSGAKR